MWFFFAHLSGRDVNRELSSVDSIWSHIKNLIFLSFFIRTAFKSLTVYIIRQHHEQSELHLQYNKLRRKKT